jgi:hypothetical protein
MGKLISLALMLIIVSHARQAHAAVFLHCRAEDVRTVNPQFDPRIVSRFKLDISASIQTQPDGSLDINLSSAPEAYLHYWDLRAGACSRVSLTESQCTQVSDETDLQYRAEVSVVKRDIIDYGKRKTDNSYPRTGFENRFFAYYKSSKSIKMELLLRGFDSDQFDYILGKCVE